MSEKAKFCPDCWDNIENINWNFCPSCWLKLDIKKNLKKEEIKENKEIEKIEENNISPKKEEIKNFSKNISKQEKTNKNNIIIFTIIIIFAIVFWYLYSTKNLPFLAKNNSEKIKEELSNNSWNIELFSEEIKTLTWKLEKNDEKISDEKNEVFENISENFKVIVEKSYFYNSDWTKRNAFVMIWDTVKVDLSSLNWEKYFASYTNSSWKTTTWFLNKYDLKEISKNITEEKNKDEEYKNFLISHYNEIKNKNYYTAFHNYQFPKAKNVDDFASWYKWVYEINLSEIQKIWENEYKYIVFIYSDSWLNKIETSIKVWEVDWKIKILGYGTKKID